jgi:MFS family permease
MTWTLPRQPTVGHPPARLAAKPAATGPTPTGLSALGYAVLLIGCFLPMLDFFIVNVALPTIDATLHASAPMLELVVAGYGTVYALMLVIGGRLGDAIGRRRVFLTGLAAFTVASLLCGLAPNAGFLVVMRIVQGVAAALIQPQVLATFQARLDGPRRARALSMYAATAGLAAAAGQLIGGLLIGADIAGLTWRPIFLVNIPVGIIALVLAWWHLPDTRSPAPAGIDVPGTLLLGVTIVALLVPLTEGQAVGWPLWTWLLLAAAPIAALALVQVERRAERRGKTPLLPPSLVRMVAMRRGLALAVPFFVGFGAYMFVFALTVQDGLHRTPLQSGLSITPMAVAFFLGSLAVPRMFARYGRTVVIIGVFAQVVGLIALVVAMHASWPDVSDLAISPGLVVAGFGQALAVGGLFRTVLGELPHRFAGLGSGVLVTVQQGSLALGVATLGTLFVSLAGSTAHGFGGAFDIVICIQAALSALIGIAAFRLPETARWSTAAEPEAVASAGLD